MKNLLYNCTQRKKKSLELEAITGRKISDDEKHSILLTVLSHGYTNDLLNDKLTRNCRENRELEIANNILKDRNKKHDILVISLREKIRDLESLIIKIFNNK